MWPSPLALPATWKMLHGHLQGPWDAGTTSGGSWCGPRAPGLPAEPHGFVPQVECALGRNRS